MLATDRATEGEDLVVQLGGQVLHLANVVRPREVEEGADVHLPVAGVGEEGGRHLVVLQHVLQMHQKLRQRVRRHRDVFHKWRGALVSLHAVERRRNPPRQPAEQVVLLRCKGQVKAKREASAALPAEGDLLQAFDDFAGFVGLLFHHQHCFGVAGNGVGVAGVHVASKSKDAAVHQVTGGEFQLGGFHGGLGGGFQAVEEHQDQAAALGNGLGAESGLGDKGQRPFTADQQAGEVELAIFEHIREMITRSVDPGPRLVGFDDGIFPLDEVGQAADDFAAARIGVEVGVVGDGMTGCFKNFAVGQGHLHAHHMAAGRAVAEPVAAAVIEGQHAPHRGDTAGRGVRPELPPERRQIPVELSEHDPRLNGDGAVPHVYDPPHRLGKIQDEPWPQRFAGQAGSGTPSMEGMAVLGTIADGRLHIGHTARPGHPQRRHLVDAAVGGIHLHEGVFAVDLPR